MRKPQLSEPGNEPRPDIQGLRSRRFLFPPVFFKGLPFIGILVSFAWVLLWADMGIAEGMEQALALPDRELDAKSAVYIGRQAWAVPHFEAKILRVGQYGGINGHALLRGEFWRSSGTLP